MKAMKMARKIVYCADFPSCWTRTSAQVAGTASRRYSQPNR